MEEALNVVRSDKNHGLLEQREHDCVLLLREQTANHGFHAGAGQSTQLFGRGHGWCDNLLLTVSHR